MELTKVLRATTQPTSAGQSYEYSAREVSPPLLLTQQASRAHRIFLLHHGSSLSEIRSRLSREKFCGFLKRFWDSFLKDWDILLHGNPAVDIYNGIKLSAGGELDVGVGEEQRGSGEREVLEGFVKRCDGLVDLFVGRYDNLSGGRFAPRKSLEASDGAIFSGIGSLTRDSIRDISVWAEWVAAQGTATYGVAIHPSSNPRRRRVQTEYDKSGPSPGQRKISERPRQDLRHDTRIPPPIVRPNGNVTSAKGSQPKATTSSTSQRQDSLIDQQPPFAVGTEVMKYLTLGVYGSSWGIPGGRPAQTPPIVGRETKALKGATGPHEQNLEKDDSQGYFLIGLLDDLDDDYGSEEGGQAEAAAAAGDKEFNSTIRIRHLHVERNLDSTQNPSSLILHVERNRDSTQDPSSSINGPSVLGQMGRDRLRVVVYVQEPFLFVFLFEPQTDSLAMTSFYRSLHFQLGPLRQSLLNSTDPSRVRQHLWESSLTSKAHPMHSLQSLRGLIFDPDRLTVQATLPNIPNASDAPIEVLSAWNRTEALGVFSQILNMVVASHRHKSELEQTCKTGRGWWVMWVRLPYEGTTTTTTTTATTVPMYREAILIRKVSDGITPKPQQSATATAMGFGLGRGREDQWGTSKVTEGIGSDAKQYIEGLLDLVR